MSCPEVMPEEPSNRRMKLKAWLGGLVRVLISSMLVISAGVVIVGNPPDIGSLIVVLLVATYGISRVRGARPGKLWLGDDRMLVLIFCLSLLRLVLMLTVPGLLGLKSAEHQLQGELVQRIGTKNHDSPRSGCVPLPSDNRSRSDILR